MPKLQIRKCCSKSPDFYTILILFIFKKKSITINSIRGISKLMLNIKMTFSGGVTHVTLSVRNVCTNQLFGENCDVKKGGGGFQLNILLRTLSVQKSVWRCPLTIYPIPLKQSSSCQSHIFIFDKPLCSLFLVHFQFVRLFDFLCATSGVGTVVTPHAQREWSSAHTMRMGMVLVVRPYTVKKNGLLRYTFDMVFWNTFMYSGVMYHCRVYYYTTGCFITP